MRHAWLLLAAACGSSSSPDASPDASERYSCAPRAATVSPAYSHTSAPPGPRAGSDCVSSGCHLDTALGAGATAFSFAGTVLKDSTNPSTGVTVRIFGASDQALAHAITDSAGNFIIRAPLTAFPYQPDVTACSASIPIRAMSSQLTSPLERSCNSPGICHGGTRGPITFSD
jgi:hypothetical protein